MTSMRLKAAAGVDPRSPGLGGPRARLTVGTRDDPLEREADRVADSVMSRSADFEATRAPPQIRPMASGAGPGGQFGAAPESVGEALASAGQPMESSLRHKLERRFGHDFSRVRIHDDEAADRSARDVGASAYTVGSDIVFGASQFAPGTPAGQRLLAHELTHVVQQSGGGRLVQRDLVYGSGYPNPFAGKPADETAAAQKDPREWFPSSVDFEQSARLSGGGTGKSTLAGLLAMIRAKSAGSITDIDLIGHANADLFALGGTITRNSVTGAQGAVIGPNQLAAVQTDINPLRDRFAPDAHITLYGCNSGASGPLLQAISNSFKVCSRGFQDAITWCLGWQTNPLVIKSRGRTLINPPANATSCDQYNASIYDLTPDTTDCTGKKPKVPDVKLPKRESPVPEVPE